MAEVLTEYGIALENAGVIYTPRAIGRAADDGMWEGWIEFVPRGNGTEVVGPVESRQPQREHLVYWATGLSRVFLEGALVRALHPVTIKVRAVTPPRSQEPAPRARISELPPPVASSPEAVLDPFEIGSRSLDVLRQELGALNRPRLMNIIAAYDLNPAGETLGWMSDAQLVHFIVVAVDTQLPQRVRS